MGKSPLATPSRVAEIAVLKGMRYTSTAMIKATLKAPRPARYPFAFDRERPKQKKDRQSGEQAGDVVRDRRVNLAPLHIFFGGLTLFLLRIKDVGHIHEIGVANVLNAVFLSVEAMVQIPGLQLDLDAVVVYAGFAAQNEVGFMVSHMLVDAYG